MELGNEARPLKAMSPVQIWGRSALHPETRDGYFYVATIPLI
jgi:hypothetical protein